MNRTIAVPEALRRTVVMVSPDSTIRIATYNIHKCRGLDGKVSPERIVAVLRELNADVIALQEVVSREGGAAQEDQARFVAEALGYRFAFGENRRHRGGRYGNVVLTRFPIETHRNYDITSGGRENRGCLRTDVRVADTTLHIFNVHFGTRFFEQRRQTRKLFEERIITGKDLSGPRIVLGDFNEWLRGSVTMKMKSQFARANSRRNLRRSKTFPGAFPVFRLDNIYFDTNLRLHRLQRYRSRSAIVASDHLPLIADLTLT
ncbi:MAG TPA: endonuclease/exonuclease/phosphatase family protein [Terriglobia bacterium]|nr:endonuclease/exonuclease/phosphatase family protein [Terriglobia bacterium]